jgi:hypothetical protein
MNSWRTLLGAVVISTCCAGWSQNVSAPENTQTVSAYLAPVDLIRAASTTELAFVNDTSAKHFFRSVKRTGSGSQTRLYVETHEAIAAMTIAYDDKPLTQQQMQGEEDHLNYLLRDADARRAKHARENDELDRTRRILKALPDAFLYEYDGTEAGTAEIARPGLKLTRLHFRPNPSYDPPSRVEQILTGMEGTILVDATQHRLALLDATLVKDVGFGWGFLGHLDKGGSLLLRQIALDDGTWDLNELRMKFTGKILIFKSLNVNSDEVLDQFKPVPTDITFAQAVEMLREEHGKFSAAAPAKTSSPQTHADER